MSGYRDLIVWEKAKKLAVKIYQCTNVGTFTRDFGFRDQIRRAAVSIPSNIAEGAERNTNKDSIRFFYISKGSAAEVATQAEIALEIGYITREQCQLFVNDCEEISRMLGSLIKARTNTPKPQPQNNSTIEPETTNQNNPTSDQEPRTTNL